MFPLSSLGLMMYVLFLLYIILVLPCLPGRVGLSIEQP